MLLFAFLNLVLGSVMQGPRVEPWVFQIISFFVGLFVLTFVFYIAGIIVVGRKRALFSDAFVIALLGTIIGSIISFLLPLFPFVGLIFSLLVWLVLIRYYYETGWLGAMAVGILAIIIEIVVMVILAIILGVSVWLFLIGRELLFLIP